MAQAVKRKFDTTSWFLVRYVKSVEDVTIILTRKIRMNKLKINNSSYILQIIEVTGQTGSSNLETDR